MNTVRQNMGIQIQRGDMLMVELDFGLTAALVVQANALNRTSTTILVVPAEHTEKIEEATVEMEGIAYNIDTSALCVVSMERICGFFGVATDSSMENVEKKLREMFRQNIHGTAHGTVHRGDVYFTTLPGVGSEQRGGRPVVIMEDGCKDGMVLAVPLTSREKAQLKCHMEFSIRGIKNTALTEHIRPVAVSSLTGRYATVSVRTMMDIETALKRCMDIN